jgi:hypothetical protein
VVLTEVSITAERAMVAVCAHLSMVVARDDNFRLWRSVLQDVLPDCADCAQSLIPLRMSAESLARASSVAARENALARLKYDTAIYFSHAAAHRFDNWSAAAGKRRRGS